MKNKDDLIYDLIFSETMKFEIDVSEYIEDIYKYDEFVLEIKKVLKKSKVKVVESDVLIDIKTAVWKLKVEK